MARSLHSLPSPNLTLFLSHPCLTLPLLPFLLSLNYPPSNLTLSSVSFTLRSSPSIASSPSATTDLERILNKFDSYSNDKISSSELAAIFSSLHHFLSSSELSSMMAEIIIFLVELPLPPLTVANSTSDLCPKKYSPPQNRLRPPLLSFPPLLSNKSHD